MGHEHLVTTSDIKGKIYMHPKLSHSGFNLRIPLKSLEVDQPAERRRAAISQAFQRQCAGRDAAAHARPTRV